MFSNYAKGRWAEEELVRRLKAHGIPARRTPLSKAEGELACDIILGPCRKCAKLAAVQYRRKVPKWIYHGWPASFFFETGRLYLCAPLEILWTTDNIVAVDPPKRPVPVAVRSLLLSHDLIFMKRIGMRKTGAPDSGGWRVILDPGDRIYILSWTARRSRL